MLYFFVQFEFISAFQSQPRRALTLLSDPLTISALSGTRVAIDAVPRERRLVRGQCFYAVCILNSDLLDYLPEQPFSMCLP